jgi:enterochelin esterase-like enzyme
MRSSISLCLALLLSFAALSAPAVRAQSPAPPAPVISPQIAPDRNATFRIAAPNAKEASLQSAGDMPQVPFGGGLPMTKNAEGVWEVTVQLDPGAYRYNFSVDGVRVLDPNSPRISESNENAHSWLHVDGSAWMDANSVQHGAVAEVHYASSVLGRTRRMHVYTPPGFNAGTQYPVLYLLHGAMDSDNSWSTVGRAGFILDNLIASDAAQPMIVVMPHGHTGPFAMGRDELPLADFAAEFNTDIKPYIEANYPVLTDRAHTAIAGLSMGGAQTLDIAFGDLATYGYVGVYSSGVFGIEESDAWEQAHLAALDDAALKNGLALVWFSTGTEDFLIETTRKTVGMIEQHGFDVDYKESGGGHTWINWREYLNTFAPQLFK